VFEGDWVAHRDFYNVEGKWVRQMDLRKKGNERKIIIKKKKGCL
jgi:hypothetical protein